MQITKIRDRAEGLKVHYNIGEDSFTMNSSEAPRQEFVDALDALKPIVLGILKLPKSYEKDFKVTGMTLTPKGEDNFKVVFVAKKDLGSGSPFNPSTPGRFLYPAEEDEGLSTALTEPQADAVNDLLREAELYVKGNRAHRQLYFELQEEAA